eukprot:Pgem_evm1s17911
MSDMVAAAKNGHYNSLKMLLEMGGRIDKKELEDYRNIVRFRAIGAIPLIQKYRTTPRSLTLLTAIAVRNHPDRAKLAPFVPDPCRALSGC